MPGIASAATAVVIGHVARRHHDDPRRRRRHHAAQPRAAGDRRAVRHAGGALSRAASTWASAARPAPTSSPRARCAATCEAAPTLSRRTCWSCWPISAPVEPGQAVRAVPGAGLDVPVWILGSSLFGAQLAAALGLPYAFASHFAPDVPDGRRSRSTAHASSPPRRSRSRT